MKNEEISDSCSCDDHHVESDRRKLIRQLSLGGALLTGVPQIASAFDTDKQGSPVWDKSPLLQSGKIQKITLLQTADIHAQLYTHDEFFLENNKAVYKKRGGFAVLKTM